VYGIDSDYNDYSLMLHYRDLLSARFSYADDFYGRGDEAVDVELSGRYPIMERLELSLGVGYNELNSVMATGSAVSSQADVPSTVHQTIYWNVGLTWFVDRFTFDIRYLDAAHHHSSPHVEEGEELEEDSELPYIDDNFVLTVSASF
jgi:hypothetical protein